MTPSLKKRFWEKAVVVPVGDRFTVQLDGRDLRTPAKAPLLLPSQLVAQMVADEWMAQEEKVNPETMPATRMANSAIDKVSVNFDAVVSMLAEYGGSDLLCYRATHPAELIAKQENAWDPVLDWARARFQIQLQTTSGIMPVAQPENTQGIFRNALSEYDSFALSAVHDLIVLSGSLVLGLAVSSNQISTESGWALSRVDEDWQAEQWGEDEEAKQASEIKRVAFHFAKNFLDSTYGA
ncbi:ATPase [Amylibacter marinus]|uniref:ATPase n=1 Tax=Amylibacter marinus TaxID=1475483 RepID=A0ABQ5VV40_9RHOB|nr:ATP12 family protein [Amylibacter marinus]GLQ35126.1 ATPase [Amylibacter marinus]